MVRKETGDARKDFTTYNNYISIGAGIVYAIKGDIRYAAY
jgi:hypothetical protein